MPTAACFTALAGAALVASAGASSALSSVQDHCLLQAHQAQPEVAPCKDKTEDAAAQLTAEGLAISSCKDAQVKGNCDDEVYGPLLQQLCPQACDSCTLVELCVEDDYAAQSVLSKAGVNVTGCGDPALAPYCKDTSSAGRRVQTLCRATCEAGNCRKSAEHEDDNTSNDRLRTPPGLPRAGGGGGGGETATAHDDPHVINMAGEKFNIMQPAKRHLMLRVPADPKVAPLLELHADVAPAGSDDASPCQLYMQSAVLSGEWFGGHEIEVQPMKRNKAGSNGAGTATLQNFSVRESRGAPWRSFAELAAIQGGSLTLSPKVSVEASRREEFGKAAESQSFVFKILGRRGPPPSITLSQAPHQALNIDVDHMVRLGVPRLGGLLGTEKHDPAVERRTTACSAAMVSSAEKQGSDGSSAASSLIKGKRTYAYAARWA